MPATLHPDYSPPVVNKLITGLGCLLGVVFLYAGIRKAGSSEQFVLALVPFTILPAGWLPNFAISLAWTEVAVGTLLLFPRTRRLAASAAIILLLAFVSTLTWALANDIVVSCGCFGTDESPSAFKMQLSIARDIVFLAIALAVAGHRR